MRFRVLLADPFPAVLAGLRYTLQQEREVRVIGAARTGSEALLQSLNLVPDVLILELHLPNLTGIEILRELRRKECKTRTLVFSGTASIAELRTAFEAGATGYLSKDAPLSRLIRALRVVAGGKRYLPPRLASVILDEYLVPASTRANLTERELKILECLGRGQSSKEISVLFGISVRTVETHRASMLKKLNMHSTPALISYALQSGLLRPLSQR